MTHILLVEDNPIDARLMRQMFQEMKDWPTQVTWINDSEKAFSYLQSLEQAAVREPLDLVLLDLNLPKYNGLDLLASIRASFTARNLPVFLLSSSPPDVVYSVAARRQLRLDGYYEKPFGLSGFEAIARNIREYCERSRRPN